MKLPKDLVVIQDTREKNGWVFEEEPVAGKVCFSSTAREALDAGDYSVKGYENFIRIERKAGLSELFVNLASKNNRERFFREMEKLREIPYKFIVVEGVINSDVLALSVPQMKYPVPGSRILSYLLDIALEYDVHTIFAGDCGQRVTRSLMEKAVRRHCDNH